MTDILATCAEVVGTELPQNAAEDSFNMLPAILGDAASKAIRPYTLHQTISQSLAIRQGDWKYLNHKGSGGNNYNRGALKQYALANNAIEAPGQLYNLANDPGETTNLYFNHRDTARRLQTLLEESIAAGRSAPNR